MMSGMIREEFNRSWLTKLMAICAMVPLLRVRKRVDHRRYNGAALLGLRGLVFKSHGSADELAFETAINRAYDAARHQLLSRVAARIAHAAPLLNVQGGASVDSVEATASE
jgi:glycerol-3-phosphate acyltransferase PlsX